MTMQERIFLAPLTLPCFSPLISIVYLEKYSTLDSFLGGGREGEDACTCNQLNVDKTKQKKEKKENQVHV